MKSKLIAFVAVAGLAFTLSSCAMGVGPEPLPNPQLPETSESTLNGGVVVGNGVTIRELTEDIGMDQLGGGLIRQGENSFAFEAGGSGSVACLSNFTAVERSGDEFNLTHRIGNGDEDMICTMDYRLTYFLVEADEPIGDDAVANIISRGEVNRTLTFEDIVE